MEFFEVIKKRKSIRSYKPESLEKEKLDKILEAARLAPTAKNLQAFKIFIIETKKIRDEIKKIYSREWIVEAPLLLLVCSIPGKNWVRNDGKNYSDVDSAIVMDHIILAATDLGIGTCWIGAFDKNAAKEILKLDDTLEPIAFTPLGYVKNSSPAVPRKSIEELVEFVD